MSVSEPSQEVTKRVVNIFQFHGNPAGPGLTRMVAAAGNRWPLFFATLARLGFFVLGPAKEKASSLAAKKPKNHSWPFLKEGLVIPQRNAFGGLGVAPDILHFRWLAQKSQVLGTAPAKKHGL